MTEELKPCPWCGGAPTLCEDDSYGNFHIGCNPCDNGFVGKIADRETVIAAWNQRHAPAAPEGVDEIIYVDVFANTEYERTWAADDSPFTPPFARYRFDGIIEPNPKDQ